MKPRGKIMSNPSSKEEHIGPAILPSAQCETFDIKDDSYSARAKIHLEESLNLSQTVDRWLEDIQWSDSSVDKVDPFRSDWPHW